MGTPGVSPAWIAVGNTAAVMGIGFAPLFIVSAVIGMYNAREATRENRVQVRFHAGKGMDGWGLGGYIPSVALWDVNGVYMGHDKKHWHHIDQGASRALKVHMTTNEVPYYMAVVAKRDAICISAIEIHWHSAESVHMILGDVGAICGMPWYHSRVGISDQFHEPRCMWVDGSNLTKPRTPGEEGGENKTWGGASVMDPPAGFNFHIPDFTGRVANPYVAAQRSNSTELWCGHHARFRVAWDDGLFHGQFRIPMFSNIPFPRDVNYTDYADASDNFANFTNQPWKETKPLRGDIKDIGHSKREILERREKLYKWRDQTLIKDEASARELCESPTSWGPDWFSHREGLFCDTAHKILLHTCENKKDIDCFDLETHMVRHKECGEGKLCGRAAARGHKTYSRVEDSRAPEKK